MNRKSVAALMALGLLVGCTTVNAEVLTIPFQGTIQSATWYSGITGQLSPPIVSQSYSGLLGTNQNGAFFATLNIPSFGFDRPGCGTPDSGCSNYQSPAAYTVTDDGNSPFGPAYSISGNEITFDVFVPSEGQIAGSLSLDGTSGEVSGYNLYAGTAFRGDDTAHLYVDLSVVPLPAAAPLFGAALLGLGALAWRQRLKGAR